MKTFYQFVLTYRGAHNEQGAFAEAVFHDLSFPKSSMDFHELSAYIEMQADSAMSTYVFDEIWEEYREKYDILY